MAQSIRTVPLLLILALAVLAAPAVYAAAPRAGGQAPGFYRLDLGDYEVTVLSDGTAPRRFDELMSDPGRARAILARDHQALPIDVSTNAFLINTGEKLVLVDTGMGGRLLDNLRAAGYRAEQVDAVLLTHMHGDHIGGLSREGKRVFANAAVYAERREAGYWLNAAASAGDRKHFEQAHAMLDPYVDAQRFHTFDGAAQLFPGISAVPAYGHTPGHTAYRVESGGRQLLLWGDTVHLAEAQFPRPDITISFDADPQAAFASRKRLMAEAARQGFLVGGAHISFPGLGHVSADGAGGYRWVPLPYSSGR